MSTQPGPGVDAQGHPVIDPTANVLALVDAAVQRQDDLREAESRHVREVASLRAEYQAELRHAETARLDAIRAVDQARVTADAAAAETRATALQAQVALSADVVRNTLDAKIGPILEALAAVQRAQYEAAGSKAQIVETRGGNSVLIALGSLAVAIVLAAFLIFAAVHK